MRTYCYYWEYKTSPPLIRILSFFRPWYRIIDVNGLECIDLPDVDVARTFVHFLFAKSSPAMQAKFIDTGLSLVDHLRIAITQHLKADPLWGTAVTANGQWDTFHISWYCVTTNPPKSCWGRGPFYLQEGSFLSRQSFSATILFSNFDAPDPTVSAGPYWTMFVLPPPEFYVLPKEEGDTFWNSSVRLRTGVLDFIHRALSRAANEWAGLDPYFDRLDAKRELIFDPEHHDGLLFDDRHFSRSRLYFWAINSLGRFIQDINITIERWERFWEQNEQHICRAEQHLLSVDEKIKAKKREEDRARRNIYDPSWDYGPGIGDRRVDDLYFSISLRIQSLKNTRQSLEYRRQKIIEYRDGVSTY